MYIYCTMYKYNCQYNVLVKVKLYKVECPLLPDEYPGVDDASLQPLGAGLAARIGRPDTLELLAIFQN